MNPLPFEEGWEAIHDDQFSPGRGFVYNWAHSLNATDEYGIDVNLTTVLDRIYLNLDVAYHAVVSRLDEMSAPTFVLLVLIILLLERLFPAKPGRKIFNVNMAQDAVWFLFQAVGEATLLAAWALLLRRFYDTYLDFLTISMTAELPTWLLMTISVIVYDFLRWAHHVLHHKVPWFWSLHAVHHSQTELNLFTDFRYHVVEYVVRQAVYFLPAMMLGLKMPELVWLSLILIWHARLTHANIKTNFGVLRFIFVTPQSHRVHHSIEHRHRDKNYGALLSIWDRMFGTQHPEDRVYPDTGIRDDNFPCEKSPNPLQLLFKPIEQMLYSFLDIGRSLRRFLPRFGSS